MSISSIQVDPNVQGGTPCFTGTRVPVSSLFDHLEGGHTIDYFLTQFPRVTRDQIVEVLEYSRRHLEQDLLSARHA